MEAAVSVKDHLLDLALCLAYLLAVIALMTIPLLGAWIAERLTGSPGVGAVVAIAGFIALYAVALCKLR